jgi:phosphoserine phosphatase
VATIALVFDFDDTLVPDSTTALLEKHNISSEKFWKEDAKALVQDGYDPPLAYLKLILDEVRPGRAFENLTRKQLREFGASLARTAYPGLAQLFRDLRKVAAQQKNVEIEFYVISGGLQDIIEGIPLITENVSGIYACELAGDTPDGPLMHVKRCVTFTEKTRYLFEVNKGLVPAQTRKNPYLVNKDIPIEKRRVPFSNMIYVGDGLTDIPCFSLVNKGGGTAFGVFDPAQDQSAKRAFLEFLTPKRVVSVHPPKYRKKDDLGALIRAAVAVKCAQFEVARGQADSPS